MTRTASAGPLAVGATIAAPGEPDPTGGAIAAGPLVSPFVALTFSGTLTSTVYSGDPSNPFPGGLTFVYQLTNNAPSPHSIERFTVNGWNGWLTDASYQTPAAGVAPTLVNRSSGVGDVVGFSYFGAPFGPGVIIPGGASAVMVIQTDATKISATLASVINGSVATAASYAPDKFVPEPSTIVLAGLGLLGLVTFARRR